MISVIPGNNPLRWVLLLFPFEGGSLEQYTMLWQVMCQDVSASQPDSMLTVLTIKLSGNKLTPESFFTFRDLENGGWTLVGSQAPNKHSSCSTPHHCP